MKHAGILSSARQVPLPEFDAPPSSFLYSPEGGKMVFALGSSPGAFRSELETRAVGCEAGRSVGFARRAGRPAPRPPAGAVAIVDAGCTVATEDTNGAGDATGTAPAVSAPGSTARGP
jgi:hypothetical protein